MTEEQHLKELEAIAASLPADPFGLGTVRALLEGMPQPTPPEVKSARPGYPDAQPGGSGIGQALSLTSNALPGGESGGVIGVIPEQFIGQSNLLPNPTLENHGFTLSLPASPSTIATAPDWRGQHVLNSGTVGSIFADVWASRANESNPFGSMIGVIDINPSGSLAHDVDVIIENSDSVLLQDQPIIGYLTAAFRIWPITDTGVAYTAHYAKVQIFNATTLAVLAESLPFDCRVSQAESTKIACSFPASSINVAHPIRARLVVKSTRDATVGGTSPFLLWGEPQLAFAATQSPPPYAPILARWRSPEVRWRAAGDTTSRLEVADNNAATPPTIRFGPGNAAMDVRVWRNDQNVLRLDGNSTATRASMEYRMGAAPPTPAANWGRLWFNSADKHFYQIDDTGLQTDLTGGGGGGGGLTLTETEVDLGDVVRFSGTFDITGLAGLTPGQPVLVAQSPGPYTGKGTLPDEAEMDIVNATGYVVDATTIRVYWNTHNRGGVKGNIIFGWAVG